MSEVVELKQGEWETTEITPDDRVMRTAGRRYRKLKEMTECTMTARYDPGAIADNLHAVWEGQRCKVWAPFFLFSPGVQSYIKVAEFDGKITDMVEVEMPGQPGVHMQLTMAINEVG